MSDYIKDLKIIRRLAAELTEISSLPHYKKTREKWMDHNDLKGSPEPLILVYPDDDGAWLDLVPINTLETEDCDLRALEHAMKKLMYRHHYFNDDFVQEPVVRFDIPGEYTGYTYADPYQKSAWGISIQAKSISRNAYHLENYLDSEENVERILCHEVDFIPDDYKYAHLKAKYQDAVNGAIEIQFTIPYVVLVQSLLIELIHLRGMTGLMLDLYDHPEQLHKILNHMASSKTRLLEHLEIRNMLYDNTTNIYTGSGGLGYTRRQTDKSPILANMWGFADAQEFSNVSPSMFSEFALNYQTLGLSKFGFVSYGCCESLDDKLEGILSSLPNVRRISVSPWTNINKAVDKIGDKAIFSWKPNPIIVYNEFDMSTTHQLLDKTANATKNCYTEIILKDLRSGRNTADNIQKFIGVAQDIFK